MSKRSAFQDMMSTPPRANINRSSFNRNHTHQTALYDDYVIPIQIEEIYPGDTINIGVNSFIRMNPTITPLMANVWMDIHYFFVPNRLTWENWEKFNGQQDNPGDPTDFLIPQAIPNSPLGSLMDFMGLPLNINSTPEDEERVNALPIRAYGLIRNQWYKDQNLQNDFIVPKDDGPDDPTTYTWMLQPFLRNKKHDYFTSCLPEPQKGPSIPIPTSATVPVLGIGKTTATYATGPFSVRESDGDIVNYAKAATFDVNDTNRIWYAEENPANAGYPNMRADLSANTDATINALRQAFALQRLYERDNRGGTRYIEVVYSHFGVMSPDARVQRPEYLGGSSDLVNMHPLAATANSNNGTDDVPQGNLTGNGSLVGGGTRITKSFTEHGYVIGLCSFRGDLSYSQGIDRHWSYRTRWDMYWPELQNISEQAVLKKELMYTGVSNVDNAAFGYNERFSHLKYKKSYTTNTMRPEAGASSTAYWNLQQELAAASLTENFIQSQTPFERVLAVPSEPTFLADFYFEFNHVRPMGVHSIPGGLTRI